MTEGEEANFLHAIRVYLFPYQLWPFPGRPNLLSVLPCEDKKGGWFSLDRSAKARLRNI